MAWWVFISSWLVRMTWSFVVNIIVMLKPGWTALSVRSLALWLCCLPKCPCCSSRISPWRSTSVLFTLSTTWLLAGDGLSVSCSGYGCLDLSSPFCLWPARVYFATFTAPMESASLCTRNSQRRPGRMCTPLLFFLVSICFHVCFFLLHNHVFNQFYLIHILLP